MGTETDPVVNKRTNKPPVTGQLENWHRRLTVHILPAAAGTRRPVTFCSPLGLPLPQTRVVAKDC